MGSAAIRVGVARSTTECAPEDFGVALDARQSEREVTSGNGEASGTLEFRSPNDVIEGGVTSRLAGCTVDARSKRIGEVFVEVAHHA